MTRAPSVIHFRCLDTMGLRDVARAIGAGHAGVRLTSGGLAIYQRASASPKVPPPPPPSPPQTHEPLETIPAPPEAAPPAEGPVLAEVSLRRPTIWAMTFLVLGIAFGAVIARAIITEGAITTVTTTGTPATVAETTPLSVTWPRTTRVETPSPAAVAPATMTLEPTIVAATPHHHHAHSHGATAEATPPAEPAAAQEAAPAPPADPEDVNATMAQARAALTDAL